MRRKQLGISFFILFFYLFSATSFAQNTIRGSVYGSDRQTLRDVSVVLTNLKNNKVSGYTFTDRNGKFTLSVDSAGRFKVSFNHIGYEPKAVTINVAENRQNYSIDVVLEQKSFHVDEVIVQAERPMVVKNDTITFRTKFYMQGNEQTVEDLLRKIPGVQVDAEGTIKVGNREIEKLMVDGDDLFEKGYKILSKNMPAYPIEEVEILKRYSDNRLLKGVEHSDKVAMNLKLDERSKRIWFGNMETEIGNDYFYQLKGNLMNFGKKNKYYFFTNLNTIGYDATGNIDHLIHPFSIDKPAGLGDNQRATPLLSLSPGRLDFKQSRTNFNDAELVSLNAIFNPTHRLKVKALGFVNRDETDFFRNSTDFVDVNGFNFTNTEDYRLQNTKRVAFGKIDLTYNISNTAMLEAVTKYNNGDFNDGSDLVFNSDSTVETLQHKNTLFDQKLSYIYRFKDKKVLLLTGRFIDERVPQSYRINHFFYQDLFPDYLNADNVKQYCRNQMLFSGVSAHLIDRKSEDKLLEIQLGNEYREDRLSTSFWLLQSKTILYKPANYQNQTAYRVNDLYLKGKYRYNFGNLGITGKVDLHKLFNTLESNGTAKSQKPLFINPSISFDWRLGSKNKIKAIYSFNTTNAGILDVYGDFVLTGFRSFAKGTGSFNRLNASLVVLSYQLGNWTNRFFANTFVMYSKNHDFFTTNTTIEQNYMQSEKILIKDREFLSINSKFDCYFKAISSNLKLNLAYTITEYKNIVNSSDLRRVTSNAYLLGLELRSVFKGIFNFHIGTKWMKNKIKTVIDDSFTNNVSFTDLSFLFTEKLNMQLQAERYFFGSFETDNTYYFLDFKVSYKVIKNKLTLGVTGKNLFNTGIFRQLYLSDIGSSIKEYRLLPRFVLLKMEFRF